MKANFNGTESEFHIARAHVPYLEHTLGRGLYAVLKDFTAGQWTFNDVATVISFAKHGPTREDRMAISFGRDAAKHGMPLRFGTRYRPHPEVVAVLEAEGHGNYASLAADILSYTIFGDADAGDAA